MRILKIDRDWRIPAVVAGLVLTGCGGLDVLRGQPGPRSETVLGNYEAVAACVATEGQKAAGGAPTLRVDRAKKTAVLQRMLASNEVQYEINFVQYGSTSVLVDGRDLSVTKEGASGIDFLWPHVAFCAASLSSP